MICYESHLDLDSIELHLLGRLPEPDNNELEEHLLGCGLCLDMAEALGEQITLIRAALKSL